MKTEFSTNDYSGYVVTGRLRNGRRFKAIHTVHARHALGINLWHGSVWGIRKESKKRELLKRVTN